MSAQPTLRLVRHNEASTESQDTLKFDRRNARRYSVSGRVTGLRSDLAPDGTRNRICPLQLLNMSDTGLGALSQESFEIGAPIAVLFPPHGAEKGFDRYGHVVRCKARTWGHEIGVRFDAKPAA